MLRACRELCWRPLEAGIFWECFGNILGELKYFSNLGVFWDLRRKMKGLLGGALAASSSSGLSSHHDDPPREQQSTRRTSN